MDDQHGNYGMVPQKLAEGQVKLIIKRVAMLYHYTAEVLVERKQSGATVLSFKLKG